VNPFILLLKPMMAVGTLVTKGVVSLAFLATEDNVDPGKMPQVNTEAAIVRVAVSEEDHSLSQMDVQLPNGEFYQLSGIGVEEAAPPSVVAPRRPGGRMVGRSQSARSESATLALLQSETGRSMQCQLDMPGEQGDGSGVCTTETGEKYEFAFQL
jgi:hypothetical protein